MKKIDLLPFHLFAQQGYHYFINVVRMEARAVDGKTAQTLKMVVTEPKTSIPFSSDEDLNKLGLISVGGEKSRKPSNNRPFPIVNLCLFLTQSCNLKCVYCYGDGGEYGTGGSMEVGTAFASVDWLIRKSGKMKKIHIGFFGGEPFLKFPLMKKVVEYAKKRAVEAGKQVEFQCTTNATLLGDEQIAFIGENNFSVTVSFDGPREIHDAQRPYANGSKSYDSTLPKIKKLLRTAPETLGHAVIMGNTDPQRVREALGEIGFKRISLAIASQSLFDEGSSENNPVRDTQAFIQSLEQEAQTWVILTQSRNSQALKRLQVNSGLYQALLSLLHNSKKRHACGAGLGLVGVSVSGDVYLCHRFVGADEYKLGSIFENGLKREEYQVSPTTANPVCAACFARYYCAGGCKHDNLSACGSTDAPSEDHCRLKRRELELAASIIGRLTSEDQAFLIEEKIFMPKPCPFDF